MVVAGSSDRYEFRCESHHFACVSVGSGNQDSIGGQICRVAEIVEIGYLYGSVGLVNTWSAEIGVHVERYICQRVVNQPQRRQIGVVDARFEVVALAVADVHQTIEIEAQIGVEGADAAAEHTVCKAAVDGHRIDADIGISYITTARCLTTCPRDPLSR